LVISYSAIVGIFTGLIFSVEVSPLEAIAGANVSFRKMAETAPVQEFATGIAVPNADALTFENTGVSLSLEEPKEFLDYRFPRNILCSQEGNCAVQVKTHLLGKYADSSCPSAVLAAISAAHYVFQEFLIDDVNTFFGGSKDVIDFGFICNVLIMAFLGLGPMFFTIGCDFVIWWVMKEDCSWFFFEDGVNVCYVEF
jgi:hypothetical protein